MRSLLLTTAFLASALLPSMGCNLYFSGGDGEPPAPCEWGSRGSQAPEAPDLRRNPLTAECEEFGWGGGGGPYPCDDACGPCEDFAGEPVPEPGRDEPGDDEPDSLEEPSGEPAPEPTWGYCESHCTGLDEGSCLATDECRGIYASNDGGSPDQFLECWQTDFADFGVVDCEGLDATSCSTSDRCVAVHESPCANGKPAPDSFEEPSCSDDDGPGFFLSCHNEGPTPRGCYGDEECDSGQRCNAGDICLSPPGGGSGASDAACYGYCEPADCPDVKTDIDCPAGFVKTCPINGCEADCTCEPSGKGECYADVFCESLPPLCESGSTPGVANGCWTGECIADELCPVAPCEIIGSESACIDRVDCSAYYVGNDCSCDGDGCTCAEWNFDSCAVN